MSTGIRYFISGHVDITPEQFNLHYKPKIVAAASDPNSLFLIGNASGTDYLAQQLLIDLFTSAGMTDFKRIHIYHRHTDPGQHVDRRCTLVSGFSSHSSKDKQMTINSDQDIAWVRSEEETKMLYGDKYKPSRISGTEQNLIRRSKTN